MEAKAKKVPEAAPMPAAREKGPPEGPLSISQPKWQRTVLDEKCRHGSFYSPLKPTADELRRSLQGPPPTSLGKEKAPSPKANERPMSPMVALMMRHDY